MAFFLKRKRQKSPQAPQVPQSLGYTPQREYKPQPDPYTIATVPIHIYLSEDFVESGIRNIVDEIKAKVPSLDNYRCTHLHCHFIFEQVPANALHGIARAITQTFPKHMCGGYFIAAFAYPERKLIKVSFGKGEIGVKSPAPIVVGYKR